MPEITHNSLLISKINIRPNHCTGCISPMFRYLIPLPVQPFVLTPDSKSGLSRNMVLRKDYSPNRNIFLPVFNIDSMGWTAGECSEAEPRNYLCPSM